MIVALLLACAAFGHAGILVTIYNTINATGLPRTTVKCVEKSAILIGASLPLGLLVLEWSRYPSALDGFAGMHVATQAVVFLDTLFFIICSPMWIDSRPWMAQDRRHWSLVSEKLLKRDRSPGGWVHSKKFYWAAKLPGNEIEWTVINHKRLFLEGLPMEIRSLRIAHISDVHLTGKMKNEFYIRAFEQLMRFQPDMIVLAGDIVDYQVALDDIDSTLAILQAPLGKFFVLGNHDRRLVRPVDVCDRLQAHGWKDLGGCNETVACNGVAVELLGNELPWFQRQRGAIRAVDRESISQPLVDATQKLRIGVSHSPDQFRWGIKMKCHLVLCGHTHGGQIRFPGIGPVVAPSFYGTKYASGVFRKSGTLMHVSRGLAGVHPYRWGCPPEVTLLELSSESDLNV